MSVEGPNKKILEIWDRLTDDYSEVSKEEFEYIQASAKKYPQWGLPEYDESFEIWSEERQFYREQYGEKQISDKVFEIWDRLTDDYSEVSGEEFEYIQALAKKYPQWNLPEFDEDFEIWSERRRSKKDKHDQIWEKFIDEPRLLRQRAESGDVDAQYQLGRCYKDGGMLFPHAEYGEEFLEHEQNDIEAIKWFTMAAARGYALAQLSLGELYQNGEKVEKDLAEAKIWLDKAAKQNNADALWRIGELYQEGLGSTPDLPTALAYFKQAAEADYYTYGIKLGRIFEDGDIIEKNLMEAIKWYSLSAGDNNPLGNLRLGQLYEEGIGVQQNHQEAFRLYSEAYKEAKEYWYGSEPTLFTTFQAVCFYLGRLYDEGWGVEQDYAKAIELYKRASDDMVFWDAEDEEDWWTLSLYNEAYLHENALGTTKDLYKAERCLKKAANFGHPWDQFQLAEFYMRNDKNGENFADAYKWYLKAAEQGHSDAQYELGILNFKGKHYDKHSLSNDSQEAVHWLQLAAVQGNIDAQFELGNLYSLNWMGLNDDKQRLAAHVWYSIAAANGHHSSAREKKLFERKYLHVDEYDKSKALFDAWFKSEGKVPYVPKIYN